MFRILLLVALQLPFQRGVLRRSRAARTRSGAGIVADSDPEKEYAETINKAKAVFEAVKFAEELS